MNITEENCNKIQKIKESNESTENKNQKSINEIDQDNMINYEEIYYIDK